MGCLGRATWTVLPRPARKESKLRLQGKVGRWSKNVPFCQRCINAEGPRGVGDKKGAKIMSS